MADFLTEFTRIAPKIEEMSSRMDALLPRLSSIEAKMTLLDPRIDSALDATQIVSLNADSLESFASHIDELNTLSSRMDDTLVPLARKADEAIDAVSMLHRLGIDRKEIDRLEEISSRIDFVSKNQELFSSIPEVEKIEMAIKDALDFKEQNPEFAKNIDIAVSISRKLTDDIKAISNKEIVASDLLDEAKRTIGELKSLDVSAKTLPSGSNATVEYSHLNNELRFGIPRGSDGAKGETGMVGPVGPSGAAVYKGDTGEKGDSGKDGTSFSVGAFGNDDERYKYDGYPKGFSFVALNRLPVVIYFKKDNQYGSWTEASPFATGGSSFSDPRAQIAQGIDLERLSEHLLPLLKDKL